MVCTYTFRIIGPGIDLYETVEAEDLDEVATHIALVVDKFKRDAEAKEDGQSAAG